MEIEMQNRYSVVFGVCFWLVLIFFGLRYFLSDWSGQGRKETATDKPSAVSAASRLSKFPALQKYCESLRSIPSGTFQMGGTQFDSEKPVHSVTLSAFRIGATPVTVAVWKEYCRAVNLKMPIAPERG
jgi:formylglycine-generating enzyme required for sulfatase activity